MIDSHCHLNFVEFDENRNEIINNCKNEFKYIVDCGASIEGNLRSLKLKEEYDGFIKSTMGYHPVYAGKDNEETTQKTIEQIIENLDNIQAIGEIGLDFSEKRSEDELKRQHDNFHKMLELASEYDMPIVLHVREAEKHALDIVKEYPNIPDVIFHCFSGGKATAIEAVDCGYLYLGVVDLVFRLLDVGFKLPDGRLQRREELTAGAQLDRIIVIEFDIVGERRYFRFFRRDGHLDLRVCGVAGDDDLFVDVVFAAFFLVLS